MWWKDSAEGNKMYIQKYMSVRWKFAVKMVYNPYRLDRYFSLL